MEKMLMNGSMEEEESKRRFVHSQVRRIQEEDGKIRDPSLPPPPEIFRYGRPAFRESSRQLSLSPLGRAARPISVGES
ncbi:hypothetical protein AMTRI_Chr04g185190 [Amborella trichopoda]|uniref:Uncharacterized protein n=1 Tax=Amborella trichopoda TaxID=13333 RepID=W1NKT6_AMBTC|nr:hypothetical protein AMTR_s00060p00102990 [Amborella trichopoda]